MSSRRKQRVANQTIDNENDALPLDPNARTRTLGENAARSIMRRYQPWRDHCNDRICRRHQTCLAPLVPCFDDDMVAALLHCDEPILRGIARILSVYRAARRLAMEAKQK